MPAKSKIHSPRQCDFCQSEFTPTRSDQRFCKSPATCRSDFHRREGNTIAEVMGFTELPASFVKSGFAHNLIQREGDVAIYQRKHKDVTEPHYEVIKISSHGSFAIAGIPIPAGETYPLSESWGMSGWTYATLESALAKFDKLTQ